MRKLIEFLFGGIIEEIALARADEIIEDMVWSNVNSMKEEVEDRVECAIREFTDELEHRIDELDGRVDDLQDEVDATKEEIDDMKGAA
ncbi:MAG: hypothetical protein VXX23_00990 [Actinomycetota bacterium]|nr:hypothetical protein [Actinomycetota bacterium]